MGHKQRRHRPLWLRSTQFLLRCIAYVAMRVVYRLRVKGAAQIPAHDPALLIPNHVTWADAILLTASTRRHIRFVLERSIYHTPVVNVLFRLMEVIPLSSEDGRREMIDSLRQARAALDEGDIVCIFAEGALTRDGMLRDFRAGFERIVKNSDYPIIPVYIGGAWGSILSYYHGRLLARPPRLFSTTVSIVFGSPMASDSSPAEVREAVEDLSCEYSDCRKSA